MVSTVSLVPNPWNPNKMNKATMEAERNSITQHGFVDPITARKKGQRWEIIDGEHRWRAAKDLGLKEVQIIDLGEVSDIQAKSLTIILNETRGKADAESLAELVKSLDASGALKDLTAATPFSDADFTAMLEALGPGSVDHVGRATDKLRGPDELKGIKMVILHYVGKELLQVKETLTQICEKQKLRSQAEAVSWLCQKYRQGKLK